MVNYICDRCFIDFGNKKIKYERHINRKYPCKKINNNLNGGDELENINKKDIILEVINKQNEKIDFLIKQNEILQEDVKNLKKDNEIFKNQIILFNNGSKNIKNTINNTNNTNYTLNIQINNFKDTKYLTENFNRYFCNPKITGKSIYTKTIEDIYLNVEKPENHNIYINDKNRKRAKIYNNGRWESKDIYSENHNNVINDIIDNCVNYYKLSIEELKENNEKYEKLKNIINKKIKYINLCDADYLDELRDEEYRDNQLITRCEEFRHIVYNEIINLLNDKKDIVKKSHKKN